MLYKTSMYDSTKMEEPWEAEYYSNQNDLDVSIIQTIRPDNCIVLRA